METKHNQAFTNTSVDPLWLRFTDTDGNLYRARQLRTCNNAYALFTFCPGLSDHLYLGAVRVVSDVDQSGVCKAVYDGFSNGTHLA